jgi:hypothetical protein
MSNVTKGAFTSREHVDKLKTIQLGELASPLHQIACLNDFKCGTRTLASMMYTGKTVQ